MYQLFKVGKSVDVGWGGDLKLVVGGARPWFGEGWQGEHFFFLNRLEAILTWHSSFEKQKTVNEFPKGCHMWFGYYWHELNLPS